ncbi:ATP-binding protein [bacterium MSK18_59]|nr:ATP-binding protein [bacterium MSK18_59]
MTDILRPVLELSVIIPGILLSYLPVKSYLRQTPLKLTAWLLPLLLGICIFGGAVCCAFHFPTRWILFPLLPVIMLIYHKTLKISVWKSVSIFLAVFAVFACVNSLSRAVNALITADLHITENELWFRTGAGIFYNLICLLFVLAAWYPARHCVQTMIADENFAQTWYVFWILPVIFIGVNLFMIPKHRSTLYTGRVLQCYIVLSLVLLILLLLFYVMFLMMGVNLNRNARLQQENHFLSLQQERYENLCMAIEEARQARHDIRHHFVLLSTLAEQGDMEKIKKYLSAATDKISDYNLHFCENQAVDSVFGHYSTIAKKENIPFHALVSLPADLSIDEINLCLVFSNLLENAIQASVKTAPAERLMWKFIPTIIISF